MAVTREDLLKEIEEGKKRKREALLAEIAGETGPSQVGDISVNRSPINLPPDQTATVGAPAEAFKPGASLGFATPQTDVTIPTASPAERDMAARGVDVRNELKDPDLRAARGFSPNKKFTANFIAEELAKQTGLPKEKMVQFDPTGTITFFNPETQRYTPIDSTTVNANDLRDMYGPGTSIAPAVAGGILGIPVGGAGGSIIAGASGAFFGEAVRLFKGREMGVHDLDDEAIYQEALKAAGLDAAGGVTGHVAARLRTLIRQMRRPEGLTSGEAQQILDGMGKNADDIRAVNDLLEAAGSKNRLKIDPVADAEEPFGLELRNTAAKSSERSRAVRAAEIKANEDALTDVARYLNRIDTPVTDTLSSQNAAMAGRPVQAELRAQMEAIQTIADNNLYYAENIARKHLADFGVLSRDKAGETVGGIVAAHATALDKTKNNSWLDYQRAIGQKVPGDEGYDVALQFTSNVKIPITAEVRAASKTLDAARKQSLLKNKAAGSKPLKSTPPTTTKVTESPIVDPSGRPARTTRETTRNTIDLAVLDDDIKEIRALLRSGDQGFSKKRLREARDVLVKLRNNYLRENDPATLALLEKAEKSTAVYNDFVNESTFSHILKVTPDGVFVPDNIAAFKHVFTRDSADAMRDLVTIASKQPGGKAALQKIGLQVYNANVIPAGGTLPDLKLHNKFIAQHRDTMDALYGDKSFYSFGRLAENVAKQAARAERVKAVLRTSPLAKFSGVAPERMGRYVFQESISEQDISKVLMRLNSADPALANSFREAVGREVQSAITTDGRLSTTKIATLIEKKGGKLEVVFGPQYVRDLQALRRMININRADQSGLAVEKTTLVGLFFRTVVSPPLTKRGRFQTLVEQVRFEALNDAFNQAVRDPDFLRAIVANGNRDIRDKRVLNLLGQLGGVSAAIDDDELME